MYLILLCLMPDQGRASRWEVINWAYLPISRSLFLNPFLPRAAKIGNSSFVIFLYLTPDDFTYHLGPASKTLSGKGLPVTGIMINSWPNLMQGIFFCESHIFFKYSSDKNETSGYLLYSVLCNELGQFTSYIYNI